MTRSKLLPLLLLALLGSLLVEPVLASPPNNPFPRPAALEPDVTFWTRIYTEVGTTGGLLHDNRDLAVVYETLTLPKGSSRARERFTDGRKKHYKQILQRLASGKRSALTSEEARVLALFPSDVSNQTLRASASRLRFQLGQADKFRAGLVRSGAYLGHIRAGLSEMGLPQEIAALPHVESSYTPHAYSRVGAAGLWQFTRSTGRRFMRVDHVVDERLDPYRASVAAARLLEQNYRVTGSWPLAITAYNHGASGMRRAARKLGTKDITTIVRKYRSRTFGFASRNFYVEFLAASEIAANPEKYFGHIEMDAPIAHQTYELPFNTPSEALADALGVDIATLKSANPALRSSVWNGAKYVPRGYQVRMPTSVLNRPLEVAVAAIPDSSRKAHQTRDTYHVVRRGETLSRIAKRYGLRMSELQSLNGLRSQHRIRAGQKLRLPSENGGAQLASVRTELPVEPQTPPPDGLYTVQSGDSIWLIAKKFGMKESELIAHNGLRNRNRIHPGQVLKVDSRADATPASPPGAIHPESLAVMTPARGAIAELDPEVVEPVVEIAVAELETVPPAEGVIDLIDPTVIVEGPPEADAQALIADPSDYTVATDGTIEVQSNETLGHFAEWLGLRASRLRSINHLRYGEPVVVDSQLKLDFSKVTPEDFETARIGYHRDLQEEFFDLWEIDGTETHRMRRGDSLWVLSHRRFNVPLWLLRQYNPDLDFQALSAGTQITVPKLRKREISAIATDAPHTS